METEETKSRLWAQTEKTMDEKIQNKCWLTLVIALVLLMIGTYAWLVWSRDKIAYIFLIVEVVALFANLPGRLAENIRINKSSAYTERVRALFLLTLAQKIESHDEDVKRARTRISAIMENMDNYRNSAEKEIEELEADILNLQEEHQDCLSLIKEK